MFSVRPPIVLWLIDIGIVRGLTKDMIRVLGSVAVMTRHEQAAVADLQHAPHARPNPSSKAVDWLLQRHRL